MAKLYGLTPADLRLVKRMIAWFNSGGSGKSGRPTPTRRRPNGGGGAAKATGAYAMLITDVPPAGAITASGFTATPGKGDIFAAAIMRWKQTPNGSTIHPLAEME